MSEERDGGERWLASRVVEEAGKEGRKKPKKKREKRKDDRRMEQIEDRGGRRPKLRWAWTVYLLRYYFFRGMQRYFWVNERQWGMN